ncbi:MAG: hypothetical protein CM15mP47_0010 [Methanobacteriota archaeon]|nr:MAG: hypothetical protein CM15mP47_0010 [Euryarchaeota archaeon]
MVFGGPGKTRLLNGIKFPGGILSMQAPRILGNKRLVAAFLNQDLPGGRGVQDSWFQLIGGERLPREYVNP